MSPRDRTCIVTARSSDSDPSRSAAYGRDDEIRRRREALTAEIAMLLEARRRLDEIEEAAATQVYDHHHHALPPPVAAVGGDGDHQLACAGAGAGSLPRYRYGEQPPVPAAAFGDQNIDGFDPLRLLVGDPQELHLDYYGHYQTGPEAAGGSGDHGGDQMLSAPAALYYEYEDGMVDVAGGRPNVVVPSGDATATPVTFSDGGGGGFGGVPASAAAMAALRTEKYDGRSGADTDGMCVICMRRYKQGKRLYVMPCSYRHRFHRKCLKKWLSRSNVCPLCRHALPTEEQAVQTTSPMYRGASGADQPNVHIINPFTGQQFWPGFDPSN